MATIQPINLENTVEIPTPVAPRTGAPNHPRIKHSVSYNIQNIYSNINKKILFVFPKLFITAPQVRVKA